MWVVASHQGCLLPPHGCPYVPATSFTRAILYLPATSPSVSLAIFYLHDLYCVLNLERLQLVWNLVLAAPLSPPPPPHGCPQALVASFTHPFLHLPNASLYVIFTYTLRIWYILCAGMFRKLLTSVKSGLLKDQGWRVGTPCRTARMGAETTQSRVKVLSEEAFCVCSCGFSSQSPPQWIYGKVWVYFVKI